MTTLDQHLSPQQGNSYLGLQREFPFPFSIFSLAIHSKAYRDVVAAASKLPEQSPLLPTAGSWGQFGCLSVLKLCIDCSYCCQQEGGKALVGSAGQVTGAALYSIQTSPSHHIRVRLRLAEHTHANCRKQLIGTKHYLYLI